MIESGQEAAAQAECFWAVKRSFSSAPTGHFRRGSIRPQRLFQQRRVSPTPFSRPFSRLPSVCQDLPAEPRHHPGGAAERGLVQAPARACPA
jgi:hypothetical protein